MFLGGLEICCCGVGGWIPTPPPHPEKARWEGMFIPPLHKLNCWCCCYCGGGTPPFLFPNKVLLDGSYTVS